MADAKPSSPSKKGDVDPDAYEAKDGEKIVEKDGRKYVEKKIGGKVARFFLDEKRA